MPEFEGGFDAIVGNPPYVDIKGLPKIQVDYIFEHYACANNRINLFAAFIERGLKLCKRRGFRFSLIVPTALLTQSSYKALRSAIAAKYHVAAIARLPNESFGKAAGDVKVDTMIFVFDDNLKGDPSVEVVSYAGYDRIAAIAPDKAAVHTTVLQSTWVKDVDCVWSLNLPTVQSQLISKIELDTIPLEN